MLTVCSNLLCMSCKVNYMLMSLEAYHIYKIYICVCIRERQVGIKISNLIFGCHHNLILNMVAKCKNGWKCTSPFICMSQSMVYVKSTILSVFEDVNG